jgi:glycerophosphoryl diester phosphodiesterase
MRQTRAEVERLRQRGNGGTVLDTPPLFLDEIAAIVRRNSAALPAQVQLDIKAPIDALSDEALARLHTTLGSDAPNFIAGGYDWTMIRRLAEAVPGLQAGFDPLASYPRSCVLEADAFRALGQRTLATARGAAMYYLEGKLVLAALDRGVNLIEIVSTVGAMVDVWTLDADRPNLRRDLQRVIEAGCHQITSNDPDALRPIVEEIVA